MSKNLEIYNKINIVLFSILILFIYFLILYDFPYYLVKAATDSGYEYLSDSLSVYAGQSQIRYNHPGFIPILLGSAAICPKDKAIKMKIRANNANILF